MRRNRHFWSCNACGAQNSREDGECQFCECEGTTCKRDSCSDPLHFLGETLAVVFEDIAAGIEEAARRETEVA